MTWGIQYEFNDYEARYNIGTWGWVRDSFTGEIKGFPSKEMAKTYGKLSFGPFPPSQGALKQRNQDKRFKIKSIPKKEK